MKTMLRLAVTVVAALLLFAVSPAAIPVDGPVQVRVADGDAGGGG
jgi:hypothetical protein